MASKVSLDDLEKRMKKLELNLKKENVEARRTPSVGLNFEQGVAGIRQNRPSSGLDLAKMNTHSRNSSDLGIQFDQSYPGRTRPSSALDLPSMAGSTQSRTSPMLGLNFPQDQNAGRLSRPSSGLDLSNSGKNSPALQRKKQIAFQLPTQVEPTKTYESTEVDKRLQEVISQNGKLRIGNRLFRATSSDFENLGEIGAGTCGQVYKMRFKPANHIMAVKQMHRSGNSEESKRILMDLDIVQKSHDCPHIVTCYGTLLTESHVWICMELMSTCFDKLLKKIDGPIPEKIVGKLTVAVVKALNYLKENQGVMHRDVKPSNILVDRHGTVKLCDFGISGRLVDSKAKTRSAGCAAYMAPERIDPPDPTQPDYDIRADVWSLGVSLVELATGKFPYANCTTDFEVLTKVLQQASPTLPQNLNFSIHFQQFVKLCCMKDYRQRPKYRTLLEHEFIKLYERSSIDIAAWLNSVLQPPQQSLIQSSKNPFHNGLQTQSSATFQPNDPFAFTAAATQAEFELYRGTQTKTPTANSKVLTIDDILS